MLQPWRPVRPDAITTGIANITPIGVKAFLLGAIPVAVGFGMANYARSIGVHEGDPLPPFSPNEILIMLAWTGLWIYIGHWYYQAKSENDPPF